MLLPQLNQLGLDIFHMMCNISMALSDAPFVPSCIGAGRLQLCDNNGPKFRICQKFIQMSDVEQTVC